ncbi:T9SS type A sorting domain-containing protein [Flavobacterium sp. DGU11]|uniref:T9SS type A sorting domain-containing protein n=1 Tax=Flavobacterium arundinis TaxID=3139143 RepID=A0ABU9HTF1_9FLAO
MMKIVQRTFQKVLLVIMVVFGSFGAGAQILAWDASNNGGGFGASPWAAATQNANVTTSGLVRGSAIATSGSPAGGAWGGSGGWVAGSGLTSDGSSFYFTVTANSGYKISLSEISTATRRSNSGPTGYTLYYSVNGGAFTAAGTATTSSTTGTTGTANSISLSSITELQDVAAGTVIKFRINPTGSTGNYYVTNGNNALRVNGTVVLAQPPAPTATVATAIAATGFTANWNAVTGATGYRLDVATDAAFTQISEIYDNFAVNGTSQFVSIGIEPNTTYYYRVRAEINATASPNSNTISATTLNPVPATVTTTQVLPAGITTTAAVSGGNVTNDGMASVTARGVVWATTTAPTTASSVTTDGTGTGTFTSNLSGLSPNTHYYYRAYAVNSAGTSYGTEYSFWTLANTPGSPTISNAGIFNLDLALDVNANPANTLYAIMINGGGFTNEYVGLNGSVSDTPVWQTAAQWGAVINVDVLMPGTTYTFSAAAQNGAGVQTPFSTTAQGSTNPLPGPTTLTLLTNSIDFEPACLSTDPDGAVGSFVFEATNLSGTGMGLGTVLISGPDGAELEGISFSGSANGTFEDGLFQLEDIEEGEDVTVYVRFDPTAGVSYGTLTIEVALTDTMNNTAAPLSVSAIIVELPEAVAAQAVCGGSTVSNLTTTSGTNIKWYTASTGGTALAATDIVTTQTYYASQSIGECESARIPVVVTVNPIPDAPVAAAQLFCGTATVSELQVTIGASPKWYDAATGGTRLEGTTALATGTYYVSQTVTDCESVRTPVAVTVNPIPDAPTAATQAFCGPATIGGLVVTTGTAPKWYAAETGGTALDMTTALATGTYYVSQTVGGCESARTAVEVTVNPIPAAPEVVSVQTFCNTATVADLDSDGVNVLWYTTATGGTALEETTAITAGTSLYYASQTINGCESAARSAVAVQLNITAAPVAAPQSFCGIGTVSQLMATGTAAQWYAAETGGTALAGTTALATGTYYVSQTINGCESARTAVLVTVNVTPAPAAEAQAFCNAGIVADLEATATAPKWYAAQTGGTPLDGTAALATGTYYVSQTLNECEGPRTAVVVTVNEVVSPVGDDTQDFEAGETLADLEVEGENIVWYAEETLETVLPETTVLEDETTYYAVATMGECSGESAIAVTANEVLSTTGFDRNSLSYYPNPVNDMLNVSYKNTITAVIVYNLLGQVVLSKDVNAAVVQLDMSSLAAGSYVMRVASGDSTATIKVIKK